MWVLALDTTTRDGSVALVRDDQVIVAHTSDAAVSHAERIPAEFRRVLADAGLPLTAVDVVAVATGPGGFTGLRIGLAAVQGLASALDRPAAGVPSLAALAWDLFERTTAGAAAAWMDAARGEVFAAAYRRLEPDAAAWPLPTLVAATAASPGATLAAWHGLVPPGMPVAAACRPEAAEAIAASGLGLTSPATNLAAVVGRLAWRMHLAGLTGAGAALAPEYVRRPDVEIERDRRRLDQHQG